MDERLKQQSQFRQFQLFEAKVMNSNRNTIDDLKYFNRRLQKMVGASHT